MQSSSAPTTAVSIALYPAATVNSASSRLRCHGLGRELARLGHQVTLGFDPSQPPQVFFVQKVINPEVLRLAEVVVAAGGKVIYDIDDYGDEALGALKADAATFERFIRLVSVVVVDTETRRDVYRQEAGFAEIAEHWVVPDPIDYIDAVTPLAEVPPLAEGHRLKACWFGNAPNIVPALPYLNALVHRDDIANISVITNGNYIPHFYVNYPQFLNSAWALESFPTLFRSMDFCVLIHSTSLEGVQKSNNKMLAALALGVVPFVSRTPAYEETAIAFGIPELVVDSPADVEARLAPEQFVAIRQKIASQACRDALEKFYPAASARLFHEKLTEFLQHS